MLDNFNRTINYLRISVTDRCNLRCTYCMPEDGVQMQNHSDIISFEQIIEVVKAGVKLGISKVRITGGEPLVRKGIVSLVEQIAKIDGIEDLSMTTNAILLKKFANDLRNVGLNRINVSLDTLDANKYREITRCGNLNDAIEGILEAKKVGFNPIKVNCVIKNNANEPDALAVKDFCIEHGLSIRYIHQMNLTNGDFSVVEGGEGGDCKICNRLRLTATGEIKPCLFNNLAFNIKELGIENALKMAISKKPKCGTINNTGEFYNIGG
ncbi:MAG: radical SAM protein [Bacteroidota bacterium]